MKHPQLRKLGFTDVPDMYDFICHKLWKKHENGKSELEYTFYDDRTWESYIKCVSCVPELFAAGHTEPEAVASATHWLKKF